MLSLVFVKFLAKCSLLYSSGGQEGGLDGRERRQDRTWGHRAGRWPAVRLFQKKALSGPVIGKE